MKKLLFGLILLISNLTFAQFEWISGTIEFKDGTAIEGLIKLPGYSKNIFAFNGKERVRFKRDKESQKEKFGPDVVKKISFMKRGSYAYVKTAYKISLFKEEIIDGEVKLYSREITGTTPGSSFGGAGGSAPIYTVGTSYSYREFYIKKEGVVAELFISTRGNKYFRKKSIALFGDCTQIVEAMENKRYEKVDIIEVVELYNDCK